MRIILYGYEYPPLGGGVANALKNLLLEFSHLENITIDFVTTSIDNEYSVEEVHPNIFFHRLKIGKRNPEDYHKQKPAHMVSFTWKAYWYTWKLLTKNKYDLTHFFGFPGGLVSLLFRWKWKYVISLRGVDVPGYNDRFKKFYIFYKPLSWIIWKFASKVISNSEGLKDLALQTAHRQAITIIPNGVDTEIFKPLSTDDKFQKFSVTAGGTLMGRKKGLKYLVEGFAYFYRQYNNSQLILIGTGDTEEELKELAKKLKVENAVKFVGRKTHEWIAENLPKFHVFALPSLSEGMSNAALEALASGLPLILTNVGGTKELLDGNGFVVQKRNAQEIQHRLKQLKMDPDLRQAMAIRSREIASELSWENVAKKYFQNYLEIIND